MAQLKHLIHFEFLICVNYFVCYVSSVHPENIETTLRTSTVAKFNDCSNRAACNSATNYELPTGQHLNWKSRNCMCDQTCVIYGDCCPSSQFYNEIEQRTNYELYSCSNILQMNYYMQQSCPVSYTNAVIKSKCEKHYIGQKSDDLKMMKPVTDMESNITYANEYCALCNGVANFYSWPLKFTCKTKTANCIPKNLTDLIQILEGAKFDQMTRTFHSSLNGTYYTCAHDYVKPENLLPRLRPCPLSVVSHCIDLQDQKTVDRCKSFTSLVYSSATSVTYKNEFCAKCCGETQTISNCIESSIQHGLPGAPFSSTFNSDENSIRSSIDVCNSGDERIRETFC